jgi:hypothetical protein
MGRNPHSIFCSEENIMSFEIDENLKNAGVENIKYYYKNCPVMGNIFTACLFFSKDNKILSRGVSICSVKDSHNKKFAREKSRSRAISAIFRKGNSLPINIYNCENESESCIRVNMYHQKSFKFKKSKEEDKLKMIALISSHPLIVEYMEKDFDDFDMIYATIPYTAPMEIAGKHFQYKSEFNPIPTDEEKAMFKL